MLLDRLKLSNFRCYRQETLINFNDITALIGKNDCGKSTILEALDIFFNDIKMDKQDASIDGDPKKVSITCYFKDLPESIIIDQDASTSLVREHLLNDDGMLEIRKTYNCSLETPKITEYVIVADHPTADNAFDLIQLTNSQLKERARAIGADMSNIDAHVNAELRECIRLHIADLLCSRTEISLLENNGKNVGNKIKSILPAYVLFKSDRKSTDQDEEAQDPLKTAIKSAIKDQEAELDRISDYVEREVRKIADLTLTKIREMDASLAATLRPQFSKPNWSTVFKVNITGDNDIPINKRGSGVRRLILLNFFRAKAEQTHSDPNDRVIYAIEEPETSQHPLNQRLIISALITLSSKDQVVITTHTPMLARYLPFESIRFIEEIPELCSVVSNGGEEEINRRIINSLGVLPDHSVKMFIGIEGKTDIPFLKNISKALKNDGADVPDLEQLELNGEVIFVPLGGSLLAIWSNRLQGLNRPEYHIYDRDNTPPMPAKYQEHIDAVNRRDDCTAVSTQKRELENYIHFHAINMALECTNYALRLNENYNDFDDVAQLLSDQLNSEAQDGDKWGQRRAKDFISTHATCYMTIEMLDEIDPDREVLGWLSQINQMMLTFQ